MILNLAKQIFTATAALTRMLELNAVPKTAECGRGIDQAGHGWKYAGDHGRWDCDGCRYAGRDPANGLWCTREFGEYRSPLHLMARLYTHLHCVGCDVSLTESAPSDGCCAASAPGPRSYHSTTPKCRLDRRSDCLELGLALPSGVRWPKVTLSGRMRR